MQNLSQKTLPKCSNFAQARFAKLRFKAIKSIENFTNPYLALKTTLKTLFIAANYLQIYWS